MRSMNPAQRCTLGVQYVKLHFHAFMLTHALIQGTWEFLSLVLLTRRGRSMRQTIEDDLESLLYVVLYCSLLWLPHDIPDDELADIIAEVFQYFFDTPSGGYGGRGKSVNAIARRYTARVKFGPDLKFWLDNMMELRFPQPLHWRNQGQVQDDPKSAEPSSEEAQHAGDGLDATTDKVLTPNPASREDEETVHGPVWSIDYIDRFWGDFLQTRTLDRNDRVIHNHPRATGVHYEDRRTETCTSYGGIPRKRTLTHDVEDETSAESDSKRSRSDSSHPSAMASFARKRSSSLESSASGGDRDDGGPADLPDGSIPLRTSDEAKADVPIAGVIVSSVPPIVETPSNTESQAVLPSYRHHPNPPPAAQSVDTETDKFSPLTPSKIGSSSADPLVRRSRRIREQKTEHNSQAKAGPSRSVTRRPKKSRRDD